MFASPTRSNPTVRILIIRRFAIRRAALRTFSQPSCHSSFLRSASPSSIIQAPKSVIARTFHQSRLRFAEEEHKARAVNTETDAVPSNAQELNDGIEEKSVLKPEAAGDSTEAGGVVEQAKTLLSNTSQKAQETISNVVGGAASTFRSPADKTLYVGNLFYGVTGEDLAAHLRQVGEVTSSRVVMSDEGVSKGFGFVEFATAEQAKEAIARLDQQEFKGRRLSIQPHKARGRRDNDRIERKTSPPSSTLYIGNMSYQMSDRDLNDLFTKVDNVTDVRVAIDRRTGQPRGFAHADFSDIPSAQRAKEYLETKIIHGRRLRIDFGKTSPNTPQITTEAPESS